MDSKTESRVISMEETTRQYEYIEQAKRMISQQAATLRRDLTFCIVTFGCQMNAHDSEKLAGILKEIGYIETDDEAADFVIYNTCTVRDNANTRVYGRLGRLKTLKMKNPHMLIALCGCMMQEPSVIEKIKESYSFVDIIFGTHNIFKLAELLIARFQLDDTINHVTHKHIKQKDRIIIDIMKDTALIVENLPNERKFFFKSGINIIFGCNNFCSYCIVPYVRGRERSREPKDILCEIERLVESGVVEIMLLGQNVNSYGKNLDSPISFAALLVEIEKIEGLERIRFMTSHPKDLSNELIEVMKKSKKICRHLHLPLQSGSNIILEKMNRNYKKEQYIALAKKIRNAMPDIAITTDIIVGFPGETAEDIEETIDVIKQVGFEGAFTFIYSKRTGTPAAAMENQISEEEIKTNFDKVLKEVQETSRISVARYHDRIEAVLVEEVNEQDGTMLTGRLESNLLVHFTGDKSLVGQIVKVKLNECKGFYFIGEQIE